MTAGKPDLVTFLTARLDEEAAAAQAAYDRPSGYRILGTPETEDHFALWKPLRVLADVAAKRRIIIEILAAYTPLGQVILEQLALPYADHSDYKQEWKP